MRCVKCWSALLCWALIASPSALADRYPLEPAGGDLIGEPRQASARHEDTLLDLARRYKLGYEEIINANPGVDPWMPGAGVRIELSKRRILPAAERRGIVINLPEHRLYFFTPDGTEVYSYPVSIGKMDWNTPLGATRIVSKVKDPPWYPPESVRREHAAKGDILPAVVPAGPDNPLGRYAMRLGIPGGAYLIHGTNRPAGVGMQVTHGCMRLYPEDIEALFGMAAVNTPVTIVNQPFKVGWRDGRLWVEVHPALKEDVVEPPTMTDLARLVVEAARQSLVPIDWSAVQQAYLETRGMPVPVTAAKALTAQDASAQKKGPAA
ncbi:MAG: L,D-transpeptidase family protein [Steroidobacteraceae bacterium]